MQKIIRALVLAGMTITIAACAVPPGHRPMPGNSAYGHAQGHNPHQKKSNVDVYGSVDVGVGHTRQKMKKY